MTSSLSKFLSRVVACALVTIGCLLWGVTLRAADKADAVPISFALDKAIMALQEPVHVELTIQNTLAEDVTFELGFNEKANYRFTLIEPTGSTVSPPGLKPGEASAFGATGHIVLKAGSTFNRKVLVNQWYEFSKTGRYGIRLKIVQLALRDTSGATFINEVSSPTMFLQVTPADPDRLSEVCRSLLENARVLHPYAKRGEAALALSYVLDPVAIPYMVKLAATPQVKELGVIGLARIANRVGIEEVISKLGTENPELEQSIRTQLEMIKRGYRVDY